jgi:hypothetical protein
VTTSGTGITGGNGDLNAGDTVTLTVAFDGAVTVAGGVPTLTLNDGGVATYSGGSGSTALTFQYTVASGENTADLAVTAIDRHGATVHDANGNDADLTHAVGNPAGILQIDTLAPHVNAVSTSPASGNEPAGSVVTFTVALNEAVNVVGGTPTLTLNDGGAATYSGGSGSTALTFKYTVASGENTADLAVTAVDRHGATLREAAGNDADLTNAVTNPAGILQIDTLAPRVNAVSASPASGNETAGSAVTFTVALNEAVNVAGGTPTLSLNDGGVAQYDAAATAALHDTTKLVFDYLVSAADTPVASLAITGIDRHGASIADFATNAADFGNLATTFPGLGVNQGTDHGVDPHGIAAPPHLADFFLV